MTSVDFTYFPNKTLGLFDFSETVINLVSDFDLHAMFDLENLLNNWTNEFDFRDTFYSQSSNFEINSQLKPDSFLKYKLNYTSADFSININYETFADMPNGVLQVTINGLENENPLVKKLADYCKKTETEEVILKQKASSGGSAPDNDQPHEASEPPKLKPLKKQPIKKERIRRPVPQKSESIVNPASSYYESGEGSTVYFFKINETNVTIGEFDKMCTQSGGAKDISFREFIEEKDGQDFVSSTFGDTVLASAIETVKTRVKLIEKYKFEVISKFESFKNNHSIEIIKNNKGYYFYVAQDSIISGEFIPGQKDAGESKNIKFNDFLVEKEQHPFIVKHFGTDFLIETIKKITSIHGPGVKIQTSFTKETKDSIVYVVSVNDDHVSVGEFYRMNNQGGGSRSYSFEDFLKSGQDFVTSHFDDEVLKKVILAVKSKMK